MNDFEQFLKQRRVPQVPAEWRAEMLAAARTQTAVKKIATESLEKPWWLAWLWPSPVAWAGVGCAWLLALGMNAASNLPGEENLAAISRSSQQVVITAILQERMLVREFFQPQEEQPAEPPRKDADPRELGMNDA